MARKASGIPAGGAIPRASRYSPASSLAIHRSSPATRTRAARLCAASAASQALGVTLATLVHFDGIEIAEPSQQVVQLVEIPRTEVFGDVLELRFQLGEYCRIDQLAQLGLAQELVQQLLVERQCLCACAPRAAHPVVQVRGDVREHERARERRCARASRRRPPGSRGCGCRRSRSASAGRSKTSPRTWR